jgi:hypothetical protein
MPSPIIESSASSHPERRSCHPADLPHGLIPPPPEVREQVEKERPKHRPEAFAGALQRLLNQWTLDYYFGQQTHEVLYRETPQGPEVLAVGFDEIFARTNAMDPEAVKGLQTWTF